MEQGAKVKLYQREQVHMKGVKDPLAELNMGFLPKSGLAIIHELRRVLLVTRLLSTKKMTTRTNR